MYYPCRWFLVDYSKAEDLEWGKGLGCDFVMKSCKHWMDSHHAKWVFHLLLVDRSDDIMVTCSFAAMNTSTHIVTEPNVPRA